MPLPTSLSAFGLPCFRYRQKSARRRGWRFELLNQQHEGRGLRALGTRYDEPRILIPRPSLTVRRRHILGSMKQLLHLHEVRRCHCGPLFSGCHLGPRVQNQIPCVVFEAKLLSSAERRFPAPAARTVGWFQGGSILLSQLARPGCIKFYMTTRFRVWSLGS